LSMSDKKPEGTRYIYGPVPSRRLGMSLGVDIVPAKICTLDCVYCQVGRTTEKSTTRQDFLDISAVLAELKDRLAQDVAVDYVTIGGSGEPTLNSRLGDLIDGIRRITRIPVAILTNGTLLYRPDVRADCAKADVVVPSLDAGDEAVFEKVNRPARDISIDKLVDGMRRFRSEYAGQIWLEVFLIEGVNTDAEQIAKLKRIIEEVKPDRVQLNSAVRPAAEKGIEAIAEDRLAAIAREIGPNCEVIGAAPPARSDRHVQHTRADVISMLKRRPCSLQDICTGLGITRSEAMQHLTTLLETGAFVPESKGGVTYYRPFATT
jgi:wyosine [tRNA(Phe)-imidazoG37] synthetase (radical SAM superfamily)